jgi:hypothetical protein
VEPHLGFVSSWRGNWFRPRTPKTASRAPRDRKALSEFEPGETEERFLSRDPVPCGNENGYNYPIDKFDLDGRAWGHVKKRRNTRAWIGTRRELS